MVLSAPPNKYFGTHVLKIAFSIFAFVFVAGHFSEVRAQANIPIYPITDVVVNQSGYFSDPYHVPYLATQGIYIAGTTQAYLVCGTALQPECATGTPLANTYTTGSQLTQAAQGHADICSAAGIHPYQNTQTSNWDAVVTLHVSQPGTCSGISGWSVIVHAHPNTSDTSTPPTAWTGDTLLVGSFSTAVDANYDGKYFTTPEGQLYLVYSKQLNPSPKRDGVVALAMTDPDTIAPGAQPVTLLGPDETLGSEDYTAGDDSFKLIETGNIRAINGKFLMAYSVGAFDHRSYKLGIAYSDTFLPASGGQYRKVMKNQPAGVQLWGTTGPKEVYYLLQADENQTGWHYVGDQVLAPGVPTAAQLGPGNSWVLTFAGYDPNDAPLVSGTTKFQANHRRPYFINLTVSVPQTGTVAAASDSDLQGWITPSHQ